jgi:4'-phosphopantetheinyl transferase EntD
MSGPNEPVIERTPHGVLATIALPPLEDVRSAELWGALRDEERTLASTFLPRRRRTFAGGRFALRAAIDSLGRTVEGAIALDDDDSPRLPPGLRGSISHTDEVACAIADVVDESSARDVRLGIDIESISALDEGAESLLLTELERERLPTDPEERALERAIKFSLKEALYKALPASLRIKEGYRTIELWASRDGTARVFFTRAGAEGVSVSARWMRSGDRVITTIRVECSAPRR